MVDSPYLNCQDLLSVRPSWENAVFQYIFFTWETVQLEVPPNMSRAFVYTETSRTLSKVWKP